jgi:hypothetical protein
MSGLMLILLGLFLGLLLDRVWWEARLNKYEAGLSVFEHYHWGLLAWFLSYFTPHLVSEVLWGLGAALILAEWGQSGVWMDGEWRKGHPFAYGTKHFIPSTVIGAVLAALVLWPLVAALTSLS